ncbi:AraC family transcriptional regulator [Methylococcus mesophilus]|uniref:AraC family transcriptional regulator n=1 Tax=Methylococcus mesophilus TaxID=2993564 RepID=UPI00224AFB0B|nr:AraC family transcriptional regulator [Methylococcus mesophilus]UZR27244.1 AraC family transcriptional regulator [Methylococcus mesophilus]
MVGEWGIFSSADLPEEDRCHVWRETYSLEVVGLDVSSIDPRPFFARVQFLDMGNLKLARTTGTSGKYHRTPKLAAKDGRDDFTLNLNISGRWEHATSRQRVVLDGRGATLLNTGVAAEGVTSSASLGEYVDLASLCIPRQVLLKRLPRADRLLMSPIADRKTLSLLEAYLKSIESLSLGDDADLRHLVTEQILDLVIFMLGKEKCVEGRTGGVRAARLAALTHYLERHYRRQSLSVDDVATALNISRRYFFELMDETGESFTEVLNRLRLDRARQSLADPNYRHLGIADIALDSGFGDISYFYRQFRRRFGETPGALRAQISP